MVKLMENLLKIYNNGHLCVIFSKTPILVNRERRRTGEEGVCYDTQPGEINITAPSSSLVINFEKPEIDIDIEAMD